MCCIAFLSASAMLARADAPAAVDLKTIIEKSIEVSGGRAKLEAIKTLEITGVVSVPAAGIDGTFSLKKKPDRALMQIDLPNLGTIRMGWNHGTVYEQSDLTGSRLVTGGERDQLLRDLDPKQQFTRLESLKDLKIEGVETIGGSAAWKLVGKSESGADEINWIDQKTYLPTRMMMTVTTQMGPIKAIANLKDYKTFDGLPIPMTTEQEAAGNTMVLKVTDVKINPDLPDAQFGIPDEVQKLLARQAATQPSKP